MKYISPVTPAELIKMLNGGRAFGDERKAHATNPLAADLRPASDQTYRVANRELRAILCSWVDDWLSTGRDRVTGEEVPKKRELTRVREAYRAFRDYEDEHRPRLYLQRNNCDDEFPEEACVLFARPPAPRWSGHDDPINDASKEAARILAAVITSDWKDAIAKCRYAPCSKYFRLQKLKPRYATGTFCCSEHHKSASAARITARRRQDSDRRLIEAAAQKLTEWQSKSEGFRKRHSVKPWLASQMTVSIAKNPTFCRHEVKPNWVTRNWARIEAQAKGGIYATR